MTRMGALEWFEPGEYDRVERVLERMKLVGMTSLRTGISWAETQRPETKAWFQWLLPRLARDVEVIPCFVYTPPSLGVEPRISSPPRDLKAYADFIDVVIEEHGEHFEWVELWNEPNNGENWDYTQDPDWTAFGRMACGAAYWARQRGKKVLLGGMSPIDPHWLEVMFQRELMEHVDAVGIHGFPGTWENAWRGWNAELQGVQEVLDRHGSKAEVWISEVGYSTVHHDGLRQVQLFAELQGLPVPRIYWYSVEDLPEERAALSGFHLDEREYHFGLWRQDGTPKLLAQLLMEGRSPQELDWMMQDEVVPVGPGHVVVTGGAGFVGANLADRLLREGREVLVYDNLARPGSLSNLEWLRSRHGSSLHVRIGDVRDRFSLRKSIAGAGAVFHLAAQVAVTTSLDQPRMDFDVNATGTLNVLEEVRRVAPEAFVLYASTNKVYGSMDALRLTERPTRWEPKGRPQAQSLSFATPYGCSKGAADQYVLDYAHTFGLATTVFRMSCIYGPLQNGTVDQGWVAHFLRCARDGTPLTIFGDGKQVRDMLHVDDLVDAYITAMERPEAVAGRAWDIGGGRQNTSSLIELLDLMEEVGCPRPPLKQEGPRPSDQAYYVADNGPLKAALGWEPRISVRDGIRRVWQGMSRQPLEVAA